MRGGGLIRPEPWKHPNSVQLQTSDEQHLNKMGPKKPKEKPKEKLKCVFYNTGYCKHGEDCTKHHPDKVCEDIDCIDENCDKRHPIPCKFGRRCRHKRKNTCLYSHVTTVPDHENFEALENKFNKKFTLIETQTKAMQNTFEKMIDEKFTQYVKQISNLRKDLEIKNTQINALEMRLEEQEKDHHALKKHQEKKFKDLENSCKQKLRKEKNSESAICEDSAIQCNKCEYKTTSRQGLKIHSSKVHSKIDFEEFPAACDICEKVLQNENELKKHKKLLHTYHSVRYQCNECEFLANEVETLNVHFGIKHTNKCGLCDKIFESSALLITHLTKCEIFMCSNSGCRDYFEKLTEMKEHISEAHRKNSPAHYSFSYCIVNAKDRSEKEITKNFFTIYPKDW